MTERGGTKPEQARKPDPFSSEIKPMLAAQLQRFPETFRGLRTEPKWNGVRVMLFAHGDMIRISTKDARDITDIFEELVPGMRALHKLRGDYALDAELIAGEGKSTSDRQRLITRIRHPNHRFTPEDTALIAAFDILYADGHNLISSPFSDRRAILKDFVPQGIRHKFNIGVTPSISRGHADFIKALARKEFEGLVLKKASSPYISGVRSESWQKYKFKSLFQEVPAQKSR